MNVLKIANELDKINVDLRASNFEIRVHDKNEVLVIFEVIRELEVISSRPKFEFNEGVLKITQETQNNSFGTRHSNDGIMHVNIRQSGTNIISIDRNTSITINNGQFAVNGRPVEAGYLNTIANMNFIDTGIVIVYIPHNFSLDELRINLINNSADIFGSNVFSIAKAHSTASNGSIMFTDVNLHNIDLTASNGSLVLDNVTTLNNGEISLQTSNGSIAIIDSKIASVLNARTSNGSINLSDSSFSEDIFTESSNGSINWSGVNAAKNASAIVSNGTVTIENSVVNSKLTARSSNGKVNLRNVDTDMDAADIRATRPENVSIQ